jgi:hypothetical protein
MLLHERQVAVHLSSEDFMSRPVGSTNSPPHSPEKAIDQLNKAVLCYLKTEGRGRMKKVTLLLPDKIYRPLRISLFLNIDLIDLTPGKPPHGPL